ncbi:MAG: DUF3857 domain-containing protein, partial [Bacteroidota bacterium]
MKLFKQITVIAIIFFSLTIHGQVKIKFGKISKEELTKEESTIEESAAAEVLAEYGNLSYRLDSEGSIFFDLEVHKRIKIYNTNGFDYANISIPYYAGAGSDKVNIDYVKGATYNLEDGKMVKTKLTNDLMVTENDSKYHKTKKLTFAQVKEGSVIEYKYTMSSNRFWDIPDWTFQEAIPVVWSQYSSSIPEWFAVKPIGQGYIPYAINDFSTNTGSSAVFPGVTW